MLLTMGLFYKYDELVPFTLRRKEWMGTDDPFTDWECAENANVAWAATNLCLTTSVDQIRGSVGWD